MSSNNNARGVDMVQNTAATPPLKRKRLGNEKKLTSFFTPTKKSTRLASDKSDNLEDNADTLAEELEILEDNVCADTQADQHVPAKKDKSPLRTVGTKSNSARGKVCGWSKLDLLDSSICRGIIADKDLLTDQVQEGFCVLLKYFLSDERTYSIQYVECTTMYSAFSPECKNIGTLLGTF